MQLDQDIKFLLSAPFSDKTLDYVNYTQYKFSTYAIMNTDIIDIALVTDTINFSDIYRPETLTKFNNSLDNSTKLYNFGVLLPNVLSKTKPGLVFGKNIYDNNGEKIGSVIIAADLDKSTLTSPQDKSIPINYLLCNNLQNPYSFNADDEVTATTIN